MTKLTNLIVKVISAFYILINAVKDLYHAIKSGLKKLTNAVKDQIKQYKK